MSTGLHIETVDRIGIIRLDRPAELNALTFATVEEIAAQVQRWEVDGETDGVVITGSGQKAFAAGADIRELQDKSVQEMTARGMQHAMTALRESSLISVAAVNGLALGGGFELALSCDIRLATPQASFGLPELGLGIIPGAGGTQLLTRYTNASVASYHILTGQPISADRAHQLGLVSELHEAEDLMAAAMEVIGTIASKGPLARQLAKRAIHGAAHAGMDSGLEIELLAQAAIFGTQEREEGLNAFLERRTPSFIPRPRPRKD